MNLNINKLFLKVVFNVDALSHMVYSERTHLLNIEFDVRKLIRIIYALCTCLSDIVILSTNIKANEPCVMLTILYVRL